LDASLVPPHLGLALLRASTASVPPLLLLLLLLAGKPSWAGTRCGRPAQQRAKALSQAHGGKCASGGFYLHVQCGRVLHFSCSSCCIVIDAPLKEKADHNTGTSNPPIIIIHTHIHTHRRRN
jgi:hypothetical protein